MIVEHGLLEVHGFPSEPPDAATYTLPAPDANAPGAVNDPAAQTATAATIHTERFVIGVGI